MRRRRLFGMLLLGALANPIMVSAQPPPAGSIQGQLVTQQNQRVSVGRASVFVCDAATGEPLVSATRTRLSQSSKNGLSSFRDLWHVLTDTDGHFEILDVPAGRYRLIGQSWAGAVGPPGNPGAAPREPTSEYVILHGVANEVIVESGASTQAFVRSLGDAACTIQNDPPAVGAFVLLSTGALRGDPILGFDSWGESFTQHIIGATHLSVPRATFIGLPRDKIVSVSVFCYDNIPGFGGGRFRPESEPAVTIPIYAGWSDGKDQPPPRLAPLVQHLRQQPQALLQILDVEAEPREAFARIRERCLAAPEKNIVIENVGEFTFIDLLSAQAYRQLQQYHEDVRTRREP